MSPNREEPDRGPDHRKPVHARTTRRARATAITIALVLVGLTAGCGRAANPRGQDDAPDCASTANADGGSPCRPDPNRVGVGTTSGSVPGTSPGRDQTTTTSTTTTTDPTS